MGPAGDFLDSIVGTVAIQGTWLHAELARFTWARPSNESYWRLVAFVDGQFIWWEPVDTGVSENRGTPKSSILIGISIINHPFWGIPIFGNTHIVNIQSTWKCVCLQATQTNPLSLYLKRKGDDMIPNQLHNFFAIHPTNQHDRFLGWSNSIFFPFSRCTDPGPIG